MPASRNALLRYKTIDKCLRNRGRLWTLEDLIDACSEALYDYEGIDRPVSKRTVRLDIQKMRSSELGYYAPIIVKDNKYYTYEDPDYSITNVPLTDEDLKQMSEAVEVLKQMSGFSTFEDIEDIVNRLEDHVSSMRHHTDPVILLETNERVKGLHFITSIHKAIIEKKQLKITYQSFKTDVPHTFVFSPFLLKEFRNRWFVFGERPRGKFRMENLALDRIVTLDVLDNSLYHMPKDFDPRAYFKDIVGVTRDNAPVETVRFWANGSTAPYIRTKPIHPSQMVVEVDPEDGRTLFQINVIINNELIRDLFGYAEGVQVVCPMSLVSTMKKKLMQAIELYK